MTASGPSGSTRPVRRFLVEPLRRFLEIEAASGILLIAATVVALVWVNFGSQSAYESTWFTHANLDWAGRLGHLDLHGLVNDGAMTVFFFVVGLEIKLEWFQGSLRDRRFARLPIVAALGGMVAPAVIYWVVAHGTAGSHGWGIPMATDIAFVVGVMALLGSRVPTPIKAFLLTLAIVDDLGSILVIAVFYASGVEWFWLGCAAAGVGVLVGLRRLGVHQVWVYVIVGIPIWYATWQSGVHATIAGVVIALCTPLQIRRDGEVFSPVGWLLDRLHPWSSFVIVPLFALANAGVVLGATGAPDSGRVALGVVAGLIVGKGLGVAGTAWVAVRCGAAALPSGVVWSQVIGAAFLAGIGFTMSLFITDLAFTGSEAIELADAAKQGILAASVIAAALGAGVFVATTRRAAAERSDG